MKTKIIKSKSAENEMILNINNKIYKINKKKLLIVLNKLENIDSDLLSDNEIIKLIDKYYLFENAFLDWISD